MTLCQPLGARPLGRTLLTWFAVVATGLVGGSAAVGQTISGTLRDSETDRPVVGGFLSLLNEEGHTVRANFTTANGTFSLGAPGPGTFRIHIARIGFANWITEPYELAGGQGLTVTIRIPRQPVRLDELRVEVTRSCLDDPSQGVELATAWGEFRKAIETAVWAEGRGELTFTVLEYERTLSSGNLRELDSTKRARQHVRLPPFRSLSATQLMMNGYAVIDPDSLVVYAPDASVFLSREFAEGYCFGLRRDEVDGAPMVGITFRPRRNRRVVDIEGTIWLDEQSAELRRVQIGYRNMPLPRGTRRRLVGADLAFQRLPDGPFYIGEWWLRFPIGHLERNAFSPRSERVLDAYRQIGGTVTEVFVDRMPIDQWLRRRPLRGGGTVGGPHDISNRITARASGG